MKAYLNGIGWVTPAGFGQGRQDGGMPLCSGELPIPTRKQVFTGIDRRFGRLDDFSRVGLAAVTFCLRDADAEAWQEKRPLGIVAASRYGCLQTDIDYLQTMLPEQGKLASPNLFAYTLPNCFLGEAALRFGLTGNSMIINRADTSYLAAVQVGIEELALSTQTGVLAGVIDLQPPSELAAVDDLPGALFLLLEKQSRDSSYGELLFEEGALRFAGEVIDNLASLLDACLTRVVR